MTDSRLVPDGELSLHWQTARYILLFTLGAWVWDVLTSLSEEYVILFKDRLTLPNMIYILARLTTGFFIVMDTVFAIAPIYHCYTFAKIHGWAAAVQISVNTLLFFFRIRAVFFNQRAVVLLFGLLWLGVTATSALAPFSLEGYALDNTGYCTNTRLKPLGAIGLVLAAINDTLVFVAITMKLVETTHMGMGDIPWTAKVNMLLTGRGMGLISRVLLKSGQLYYVVTIGFTVASATSAVSDTIPDAYAVVAVTVNGFFTNVMTTRLYRHLKLGLSENCLGIDEYQPRTSLLFRESTIRDPISSQSVERVQTLPVSTLLRTPNIGRI